MAWLKVFGDTETYMSHKSDALGLIELKTQYELFNCSTTFVSVICISSLMFATLAGYLLTWSPCQHQEMTLF